MLDTTGSKFYKLDIIVIIICEYRSGKGLSTSMQYLFHVHLFDGTDAILLCCNLSFISFRVLSLSSTASSDSNTFSLICWTLSSKPCEAPVVFWYSFAMIYAN